MRMCDVLRAMDSIVARLGLDVEAEMQSDYYTFVVRYMFRVKGLLDD